MFNLPMIYLFALILIIGYLLGNIHGAFIIGKLFKHEDIRNHGSHNSGSTNALRVFGFKIALPSFIIDFSKAFFPVFFAKNISEFLLSLIGVYQNFGSASIAGLRMVFALGVLLGHNYPFVLKFKGGKGIACSVGILMAIHPICGFSYGLLILAIAFITGYVSLGSIISSILCPVVLYFVTGDMNYVCIGLMIMVFAVYRHKTNIERLKNGTENKFGKKKETK